jgi:serine/threonine protein kinase
MEIRIASRYKLVKKIGGGAFGQIYQALDVISSEKVAVKLVRHKTTLKFL